MIEEIHRGETMLISIDAEDFPITDLSNIILTIKHCQNKHQYDISDFALVTNPDTGEQEYQLVIGQEMTLSWSVKNIVTLVLETVTTSGTRVWQCKKEYKVGETEYDEVMV